jgi:predicted DNA-binding ribbon-helix-helix protein
MSIIKKKHKAQPFVMIDKTFLEDSKLSWKAKGLMGYLLSRPENWSIRKADLVKRSTDSETVVETILNELMIGGYIYYYPERNPNGTVKEWVYLCFETPEDNPYLEQSIKKGLEKERKRKSRNKRKNSKVVSLSPEVDNPEVDNPEVDNPEVDNPPHNNNDFNKKDFNNNDFNNIYLSEIEKTELSQPSKKILAEKIDRLDFHSIKISQLINHLLANKEIINEHQYINTLVRALDNQNEPIRDYSSFMDVCIKNYIKNQNKGISEGLNSKRTVRKEIIPEYMINSQKEHDISEEQEETEETEEVIKKREELQRRIAALK